MSALHQIQTAPDDQGRIFDALAEAMAIAETYSRTAVDMAAIRDLRGAAYAVRSASAAIFSAASMLEDLRPSLQQEGRAA